MPYQRTSPRRAHSRSRGAPRLPIRRQGRAPVRSGTAREASAQPGQSSRRSAAGRWRRWKPPSSAARRPASSCVRRDRRKWPKRADPIGRAKKAIPNVASDASVAVAGSDRWKEQGGEDEHRCGAVDVEVEELDGGADHAGEQHVPRRVDGAITTAASPCAIRK